MSEPTPLIPVILCGGSGTRLWPASRDSLPKQFIALIGELSTFQAALQRVEGGAFARPIVIANSEYRFLVADQADRIGMAVDIVLEPVARDSGPAVAVASVLAQRRHPDAIVLVLAADHIIPDKAAFAATVEQARAGVEQGLIMTFGVTPDAPATGYGYIRPGPPVEGGFRVAAFLEKPDQARAEALVAEGCLWNSGNFMFQAKAMLQELATCAPAMLAAAEASVAGISSDLDFMRLPEAAFAASPKLSIDYAVMEKTANAGVTPAGFAWSDVGTWGSLWSVAVRDADGNSVKGPVELRDTRNSLVHADTLLTTVVGLDDVVVVTTRDAVLVTSRAKSESVKALVQSLKSKGVREASEHLRMYRPWGWYQRTDIGARFQVKRIQVQPGKKLSLQKHFHRAEHWVVVRGTAEVTIDGVVELLQENQSIYLPLGCVHRLANPGRIPLEIIEVQVGSYTGEDDIVRLDDDFNRQQD
jgi:mannose-1-phosphate guanylyltransferase / mannose-6-phosphate isomerase